MYYFESVLHKVKVCSMKKTIVVFAPHPDDETLGCGGTIMMKLREKVEVYVVVMTDGRHSHNHTLGIIDPSPVEIRNTRRNEFQKVMRILGVKLTNTWMLDFEDGKLKDYSETAIDRVANILFKVEPSEVYVTCRDDKKRDHESTFTIVEESIERACISPIIYEYPIWSRTEDMNHRDRRNVLIQDITQQIETKKAALKVYRSQTSIFSSTQREPILQEPFIHLFLESEIFFANKPATHF